VVVQEFCRPEIFAIQGYSLHRIRRFRVVQEVTNDRRVHWVMVI